MPRCHGSPPRVRGTDAVSLHAKEKIRITPACAGNSHYSDAVEIDGKDHPRVCGEQLPPLRGKAGRLGSPPRVRGTGVHAMHSFTNIGSPPRVRGTAKRKRVRKPNRRITPACAGNRLTGDFYGQPFRDHPRVCGEQEVALRCSSPHQGSPPRVRGTVSAHIYGQTKMGITPACAGNSSSKRLGVDTGKDHPRVCGEQRNSGHHKIDGLGSPPRVRGTVALQTCK